MSDVELRKRLQEDAALWRLAYNVGAHDVVINKLSWAKAVALAVEASRIYGIKQVVFKDPRRGWTYRSCEP
jgi:hypothetical protein